MSRDTRLLIENINYFTRSKSGNVKYKVYPKAKAEYKLAVEITLEDLEIVSKEVKVENKGSPVKSSSYYMLDTTEKGKNSWKRELASTLQELSIGTPGQFWVASWNSDIAYGRTPIVTSSGKNIQDIDVLGKLFSNLVEEANNGGYFAESKISLTVEGANSEMNIFYSDYLVVADGYNFLKVWSGKGFAKVDVAALIRKMDDKERIGKLLEVA